MEHQAIQRSDINPEFGQINELFNKNIKLIKMIIEYIYDVYFIENNNIDIGIMIYKIMKDTENPERLNLILTKDKYDFQLLRYNKNNTGLIYMTPKQIQWLKATDVLEKVTKLDDIEDEKYIHYLGLLYAIGGLPSRSINGIKGIGTKKAFKMIKNYWDGKDFFTANISDFIIREILTENNLSNCIDYVISQYKSIDIEFGVNYLLNDADNFYLAENIYKNKYDNESIIALNDKYYKKHPINLIYLAEGCNLKKREWNYQK
jgi:5'-3' exonuclease